ncbi:MAG TPA: hypothetical protein VFG60_03990 [Burkholderiaceae bacterium]|nr:hypothetical protein [Burkholderiaceae bacterium]
MKKANQSTPSIKTLEDRAVAERKAEMRDAQGGLADLGDDAGLREDWLDPLLGDPMAGPDGTSKPRKVRKVRRAG